jgi:hypothetical protein
MALWSVSMLVTVLGMALLLARWSLRVPAPVREGARGYASPARREPQRHASNIRQRR